MALRRCLRRPLHRASDAPILALLPPLPRALARLLSSNGLGTDERHEEAVEPSGSLQHRGGVGGGGYVRPKKDALDDAPHRRWEKGGGGRGGHRLRGGQVLTGAERVETLSHFCKELTRACDDDNLELAFEVLDKMFNLTLHPPIYLVRAVMRRCMLAGRWDMALDLLERHHQHSQQERGGGDARLYGIAINACRRAGRMEEAMGVLATMKARGVRPDVVAYTTAIQACGRAGEWERAVQLLGQASSELGPPALLSTRLYNAVLWACARGEAWEEVQRLVGEMEARGVSWDRHTYRALIDSWARAKRADKALELLQQMEEAEDEALRPDVPAYNMVMAACLKRGWPVETLKVLKRMRERGGLTPDRYSYVAAITACGACRSKKGGSKAKKGAVLELLQEMKADGHDPPDRLAYSAALTALARAGEWQAALSLLEEMVDNGHVPEFWGYAAATEACRSGGAWRQTLNLLHSTTTASSNWAAGGKQGSTDYYRGVLLSACSSSSEEPCGTTLELVERMLAGGGRGSKEEEGGGAGGEVELWKAVVSCQHPDRWRSLATLALRSGRGRRRPKGVSVQLQCVTVLAGVRLGLLDEALQLFMRLDEQQHHDEDERVEEEEDESPTDHHDQADQREQELQQQDGSGGAAAVALVSPVLVRAVSKRPDGWKAVLAALQETGSCGLASHKLALEACVRAGQWQELLPVVESYGRRAKEGEQALYDHAFAVMEEVGALVPVSPEVAEAVWARERSEQQQQQQQRQQQPQQQQRQQQQHVKGATGGDGAQASTVLTHVDRKAIMHVAVTV